MTMTTRMQLLEQWLEGRLPATPAPGWKATRKALRAGSDRDLYIAISLVSRKIGKSDLALTTAELGAGRRGAPRLGSARLEPGPGGARLSAAGTRQRRAGVLAAPGPVVHHGRHRRTGGFLQRTAAVSGPAAPRAARRGRRAHQHESRVPGGGAPQSLSRGAVAGGALEPDGAEGPVHRHQPRSDRRPGPPRRIPNWRACCGDYAHERWSAGRPSAPSFGAAWGRMRPATCSPTSGGYWKRGPIPSAQPQHWPWRVRPIRRQPGYYGRTRNCRLP